MNVTLRKYGNSTVAVIPPRVLKALKAELGEHLETVGKRYQFTEDVVSV